MMTKWFFSWWNSEPFDKGVDDEKKSICKRFSLDYPNFNVTYVGLKFKDEKRMIFWVGYEEKGIKRKPPPIKIYEWDLENMENKLSGEILGEDAEPFMPKGRK